MGNADDKLPVFYRCWSCRTPLIKKDKSNGLIKSQILHIQGNQITAKCKNCKADNILPIAVDFITEPRLVISLPPGLNKNKLKS